MIGTFRFNLELSFTYVGCAGGGGRSVCGWGGHVCVCVIKQRKHDLTNFSPDRTSSNDNKTTPSLMSSNRFSTFNGGVFWKKKRKVIY